MLVGTGIITTMLCTRIHILTIVIISFFYSAVLYPIVSYWLWMDHGWMQLKETHVKDYAGGLSVYTTASTFASVGAILLGRRVLRLSDISEMSVIGVEVPRTTVAGYMFVIVGLIVFSLPTPEEEFRLKYNNFDGVLFTNSVLALSAAALVTILLDVVINRRKTITYWPLLKYLQAAIAGIIALSSGIDIFSAIESFIVGIIAGITFFCTTSIIHISFIEDNCNIIASYFSCSFLSSLLSQYKIHNSGFLWQLSCYFIIFSITFVTAAVLLLFLYVTKRFRSKNEVLNHERAKTTYRNKLFRVSENAGYIEPGTFKATMNNNSDTEITNRKIIKSKSGQNSTPFDSKESIVTQLSSIDNFSRRPLKKYINLQKSSSKSGRFRSRGAMKI